jgi:peptidoglycan/xylan/chitin deacetylase (PgdA/CDA1 family)
MTPPLPTTPGTARRWRPTPLITGSAALHAGAVAAVVAQPAWWPWAAGGVVASHLALMTAGLWPRSALLGPNWTRLPEGAGNRIALTIDDGPHPEVTPRVLDLLDRYEAHATFFCIGGMRWKTIASAIGTTSRCWARARCGARSRPRRLR